MRLIQNEHASVASSFRSDLEDLRSNLHNNTDHLGHQNEDLFSRVQEIELGMEEMLDKLWELDKSWKNNLVFYGVKSDEGDWSPARIKDKLMKHFLLQTSIPPQ